MPTVRGSVSETAVAINRRAKTVRTASGSVERYDDLIIATGSRPAARVSWVSP